MFFVPKVLPEYMIGRAVSAIEAVSMLGKPIAEVSSIKASEKDVLNDLKGCLALSPASEGIQPWIWADSGRMRFGFYREPWALEALKYVDQMDPKDLNRHWIAGLLFGYRPERIQEYLDKERTRSRA